MANYIINYEPNRFAETAGIELLPATFGEGLSAAIETETTRGPTQAGLRATERARYEESTYTDEFGNVSDIPATPSRILSPEEASKMYGLEGMLTFDEPTPEPVARQLYDLKIQETIRKDTMRRADTGLGTGILAGVAASFADPIYLGSAFIPVVGEARFAAMTGRIGTTNARLLTGAIEGSVGAAVVEPMVLAGAMSEQADYTAADSMSNIVFGGVVGGGLHLGAGYIGDRWAGRASATPLAREFDDLAVEDRAAVITGAAEQLESRRPVDVQAVADAAIARAEERRFLDPHEMRIEEFATTARQVELTEAQTKALLPKDIRDPVTGFYQKEDRIPTMERAQRFLQENGGVGTYVEADIANLGGLNARFGNSGANKVYREMSDIFEEAIKEAGGTGILFRHGGDEISAIVLGVPPTDVERALAGMQGRMAELVERRGLADIPHAKDRRLQPGTRLNYGVSEIRSGVDPDVIFKDADLVVEKLKKVPGNVNRSKIREAGAAPSEGQTGRIGAGDRRNVGGAGRQGRALRTGEAFRRWTDKQSEPYIAPELAAGMKAADESVKLEAGPPKELGDLISETEAELRDIERSLSDEDFARFDAEPEEGTITTAQIEAMEKSAPAYDKAVQQAANCLPGRR